MNTVDTFSSVVWAKNHGTYLFGVDFICVRCVVLSCDTISYHTEVVIFSLVARFSFVVECGFIFCCCALLICVAGLTTSGDQYSFLVLSVIIARV